jgi:hypothetical protein
VLKAAPGPPRSCKICSDHYDQGARMAYLQQFLDPDLKVKDETAEQLTAQEIERLSKLHAIALAAMAIPRRIGGEASNDELSADKRRAKRVAHVAGQCVSAWGIKKPQAPVADITRQAAQVVWQRWWEDHRVWLLNRMRYIATWQYKTGGDERWAKSAITKLNNELGWLEYALRD